jgi:hypothetical protein
MDADDMAVTSQAKIPLNGIGTLFHCKAKGSQRVFRCVMGSTTMANDKR